ncbi:hypothetical protein GR160_03075 [Flavobacterium sp. Sd200]|uniref:hypothetical protein n=1 Tax=Flavobacterium sp. Sd200 TaxID=2692211 RepID=UPI0013709FC1|nr:hypothetical protein [Flavobacterium sp. Sd200]MXN90197.1 hypothetical protein [Flavobacterium sp. Sd200]
MKIVKYIFLLLLLASIATTVFIATQDGKYTIKREKVINVSRPVLYNYLNDYKNWENLGFFANADTLATYSYSDNSVGAGATMSWLKDGNGGRIETLETANNDSINQKAELENLDANVTWILKDTLKSTKVKVRISGKLTFTQKAYALLNGGTNVTIDSSLEKGLVNLNNFLVKEVQKFSTEVVGVVNKKATFYLGTTSTLPIADVNKKAIGAFDKLLEFSKENRITVTGKPFILYQNINKANQTATCTYSIPIKDEMYTAPGSDYAGGKLLAFNALKTTLRGDYSHLPKGWQAARKYMSEKKIQEKTTAQYLEVYTKGVSQTRRPSLLVTDIYIPVGAPDIIVTDTLIKPVIPTIVTPPTGSTAKPTTTNVKPVINPANNKPTSSTVPLKQAGSILAKPAGTTTHVTPQKQTQGNTSTKPASTTPVKPSTTNQPKPKPAKATTKPTSSGGDDLNPPRA